MKALWHAGFLTFCLLGLATHIQAGDPVVLNLWPAQPPGAEPALPAEADFTKSEDKLIAGRRIIKLGNVSIPQIAVYRPTDELNTGTSVVICPGGGHHILAYDLEGTEVAEWLNTLGVTGIVLKYRVPARDPQRRWSAAVQDAQRAMSLVRQHAPEWKLDPQRIGICGFSAGGQTAGLASLLFDDRQYETQDETDAVACRPDFAILVYPAWLVDDKEFRLLPETQVTQAAPPMFFVHAIDDPISAQNSLLLASELKKVGVSAELHVYSAGGHGYGLRKTDLPVTTWPDRCEEWMQQSGWLTKSPSVK